MVIRCWLLRKALRQSDLRARAGLRLLKTMKKKIYGLQFHPEVQHTPNGMKILRNFAAICGCRRDYSLKGLDRKLVKEIKNLVRDGSVVMGVSGGVDSLVASVLIRKATPNVHCVLR